MKKPYKRPSLHVHYPPLPLDLTKWGQDTTRRIYQALNNGSNSLGHLQGLFTVDGHTIRVLPPEKGASTHRMLLVLPIVGGYREIPVGRVGQAFQQKSKPTKEPKP